MENKLLFVAESIIVNSHLFKPVRVWERKVWESPLPLYKVPGSPYIVIPGYHPLHGVTHHVHVYWHGQIEPEYYEISISMYQETV